jgi:hypothetical protein
VITATVKVTTIEPAPPSPIPTDKEARAALAKELFGDMSWMDDKPDTKQ